jgi:hypothetical protein
MLVPPSVVRPKHTYKIPSQIAEATGTASVGLVELTAMEEMQATKKAGTDTMRIAFELAKSSLVEMNGKPLSRANGEHDSAWQNMHPKIRSLVLQAYTKIHQPESDEVEGFLESATVEVG